MFVNVNPTVLAIGAFIVVVGVLIFVHELGHFLAAKAVGIAVLRFSFGLGPRTPIGVKIGETDYCLSWIPFGGFVKMAGIEEFEEGAPEALEGSLAAQGAKVPRERTFDAKPLWARIGVILAGVTMNAVFAVAVYAALTGIYGVAVDDTTRVGRVDSTAIPLGAAQLATLRAGDRITRIDGKSMRTWRDIQRALLLTRNARITIDVAGRTKPILLDVERGDEKARAGLVNALEPWHEPVIGEVASGEPASAAGVLAGDRIDSAGGEATPSWERLVRVIERSPGRPLPLVVRRGGRDTTLIVTPRPTEVSDPAGGTKVVGRVGFWLYVPVRHFGVVGAVGQGFARAADAAGLVLFTLRGLVTGQVSTREIGGPILVGQLSGEVARLGLEPFLAFMALFSINLAILNLLPIPVLDGGHLAFLLIEGVRGSPLSVEQRQRLTQIGFFVLVGIMALALANDVLRLFH
jgi:regulator of sigma E protease